MVPNPVKVRLPHLPKSYRLARKWPEIEVLKGFLAQAVLRVQINLGSLMWVHIGKILEDSLRRISVI